MVLKKIFFALIITITSNATYQELNATSSKKLFRNPRSNTKQFIIDISQNHPYVTGTLFIGLAHILRLHITGSFFVDAIIGGLAIDGLANKQKSIPGIMVKHVKTYSKNTNSEFLQKLLNGKLPK